MGDMIVDPAKMLLTLVGGLTQPIFQNGRLRADHKIAQSQQQAQIAFGDALLRVGCEVADAAEQKATLHKAQSDAAQKAFENSLLLMQHSQSVGYLEVLTAQSSWLNAQLQTTADRLQWQQAKINLYNALCR